MRPLAPIIAIVLLGLAACQQAEADQTKQRLALPEADARSQRIDLEAPARPREAPLPSPDTAAAIWAVAPDGRSITFGNPGASPWLSLECRPGDDPPRLAIIRHAAAMPGQKALLAVIGNGRVSRLPAEAVLAPRRRGGQASTEWRWEANLPAADPQWAVLRGGGEVRATLPAKGMIVIRPGEIPGQFVDWCRAQGNLAPAPEPGSGSDTSLRGF